MSDIKKPKSIEEQKEAERKRDKTKEQAYRNKVIGALEGMLNHTLAKHHEDNAEKTERKAFERKKFGIDLAAVIGAYVAAAFLLLQDVLIRIQTTEAKSDAEAALTVSKDTEQRQLRAYVGFDAEKWLIVDKGNIGVKVTARNYGQTPADEVQINAQGGVFHVPLLETEHLPDVQYLRGEGSNSVTILPGHENTDQTTIPLGYTVNDPRIQTGIADGTSLYIVGKATYYDAFGEFRFTDFCFIIRFDDLARVGAQHLTSDYTICPQRYTHSN